LRHQAEVKAELRERKRMQHQTEQVGWCWPLPIACVSTGSKGILQTFGKKSGLMDPGAAWVCWPCQTLSVVSTMLRQLDFNINTKTKDHVTVEIALAVQFYVKADMVEQFYFGIHQPERHITSSVMDAVRTAVPGMTLEEAFAAKNRITEASKVEANKYMESFGVVVDHVLCTNMKVAGSVTLAMNMVVAARRLREASVWVADSQKIIQVKKAEGEALRLEMSGAGTARMRSAIAAGLSDCVVSMEGLGLGVRDILVIVLMNDYIDTLKKFATSGASHILVPTTMATKLDTLRDRVAAKEHVHPAPRRKQITNVASTAAPPAGGARPMVAQAAVTLPTFPPASKAAAPLVHSPLPEDEAGAACERAGCAA